MIEWQTLNMPRLGALPRLHRRGTRTAGAGPRSAKRGEKMARAGMPFLARGRREKTLQCARELLGIAAGGLSWIDLRQAKLFSRKRSRQISTFCITSWGECHCVARQAVV